MHTFDVQVTQVIRVTVDPSKFTGEFMEEFRKSFFGFETLGEHVEHLAQMAARGVADNGDFIEGYGPAAEMGIRFAERSCETEIVALFAGAPAS